MLQLWRSLTQPSVEGDFARRREAVLLNALATFAIGCAIATVLNLVSNGSGRVLWPLVMLSLAGLMIGLSRVARRGRHRAVALVFVALLTTLEVSLVITGGFEHPLWPLLSAYVVVLAAVCLGRVPAIVVLLGHGVLLQLLNSSALDEVVPLSEEGSTTSGFGALAMLLVLALIAQSLWHYTRESQRTIDDELTHGAPNSPLRQLRTKHLTARELEVVQLVADGLSNQEIAQRLIISPRTVHSHVANALAKTGCSNRTELGVLAVREGLVPLEVDAAVLAPG